MKIFFRSLLNFADTWAAKKVVRVALFGQGLATEEWQTLSTTPYASLRPIIRVVSHPSESEIMAIHGPLNSMNWHAFEQWAAAARMGTRFIAVGNEIQLSSDGRVIGPQGELSQIQVNYLLPQNPPTPKDLRDTITCMLKVHHV